MKKYNWIPVDHNTPEEWYFDVKTASGKIHRAKLHVTCYPTGDNYDWMLEDGYSIREDVRYWNKKE